MPGFVQGAGDGVDFGRIRRPCPPHPSPHDRVGEPGQHSSEREPTEAGVANGQGFGLPPAHMTGGRAVRHIDQVHRLHK